MHFVPRWTLAVLVAVVSTAAAFYLFSSEEREQPALTWAALRNATYASEFPRSKQAPLQDGVYEEEIVPGAATRLKVQLADIAGFGRIDGDNSPDAAVILISSPGGSGTFIHLAAVANRDGIAVPVATTLLGDRVAVRSIRVEAGKIIVGMRVRVSGDPFAVLTTEIARTYSLQDDELVQEREQTQDVRSPPPDQFSYQPQRLALDMGKPSNMQGTLVPGELATFLLRANEGQELRVTVRSQFSNAILSIQGVDDGTQVVSRSGYATSFTGRLASSQDYAVTVISLAGNDLSYSLSIELRAALTVMPTATARPAPTPTMPPGIGGKPPNVPAPISGAFRPEVKPLTSLSSGAARYLESRAPAWGIAVASPADAVLYAQNGDVQLELASVVKVLVALAVMDAAQHEGRYVDRFELSLLWPMITLSDNDSTTELWDQLGGGRGLGSYLASIGATEIKPHDGPSWGTSTASARSLAVVLSRAAFGNLLNAEHRVLFLSLLQNVTPSQRWGISAGAEVDAATVPVVGIKDGWYPADAGWRVNSVGFVVGAGDQPFYTITVLTNYQPSWEYGIRTIEGAAEEVNSVLLGSDRPNVAP